MEQIHFRKEHGKEKSGKFAAYLRVSTDKQDVANQEYRIKEYLNGGEHDVKWFKDEGVSSGMDWDKRKALQLCLDYCRNCLLYTSPSPRDGLLSRMPSSA